MTIEISPPESAQEPTAVAPDVSTGQTRSLEDLLADLPEDARKVVLGEVTKARSEAKNLRTRLQEAEPKVSEYDRLAAASKTDAERAQEALKAAEDRAASAFERVARAEVKAALSGLVDDPESIVEDLDMRRFTLAGGEVNPEAVSALKQRFAGFAGRRPPRPDPSQASGAGGASPATPADQFASFIKGQLNSQ